MTQTPVYNYVSQIGRLFSLHDVCRATGLSVKQMHAEWNALVESGTIVYVADEHYRYEQLPLPGIKRTNSTKQRVTNRDKSTAKAKVNTVWQSILQKPGKLLREYQPTNISINTMYAIGRALEQGGYIVRKRHCCWPITDTPTAYIRPIHKAADHA